MADIDNFFAKKDRKKSKGKKFTTSDNTGNPQEEPLKKIEKTKAHLNESDKAYLQSEEEWNEYQEQIKDYTLLKIQNLTIDNTSNFSDNNDKDDEIEFEENEAGEIVPKRKPAGPWKVQEVEPAPTPKAPEPVKEEKAEVKKNVYVPPNQRYNFQGAQRSTPRCKTSLDVKNEEMFPTLAANPSKKTTAPAKKAEIQAWSKYQ